jgi:hypothetical protein
MPTKKSTSENINTDKSKKSNAFHNLVGGQVEWMHCEASSRTRPHTTPRVAQGESSLVARDALPARAQAQPLVNQGSWNWGSNSNISRRL